MTKEELLHRINDIEWDDFEMKLAQDRLPNDVWETVSAFSNTSGGWIVFGVHQHGQKFDVTGCNNAEKTESDFLNTLRNGQKFNVKLSVYGKRYVIEGKTVLAFYVPSSMMKPVYFGSMVNTFIRSGSGDRRATDMETMAIVRDQSFGWKSEQVVPGTGIDCLNAGSMETYRNHIALFNPTFPYLDLPLDKFCKKVGICTVNGELTFGGMLMFGGRDVVQGHLGNFWIDYLEIPGTCYADASVRYSYRLQEQDNIWESYQLIIQRLRNFCDNPYEALASGVGPEDESQLFALREGLVNLCAHADYFSPMHPTIRVYSNRIEFQNPGRFMFPLDELRSKIHSMPRNPSLIKFFRYARLGENAGYGIDKMLTWQRLTGMPVDFHTDLSCSTVTYWLGEKASGQGGEQAGEQGGVQVSEHVQRLVDVIGSGYYTLSEIQERLNIASRRYVLAFMLTPAIRQGYVLRTYPDKPRHPRQRYYLSEKGLRSVTA